MESQKNVLDLIQSKGKRRLVMVTATDEPSARWADRAGVDIILVGDSLSMVALGRPNTLSLTMEETVHHVRAVRAGCRQAMLVADMPFGSFQVSVAEAVRNACRLVGEGGAQAIKLEGPRFSEIEAITQAGIPVMGHLGLTPQSLHRLGGYRVQGKESDAAIQVIEDARGIEKSGAFSMVLEAIPPRLGEAVTRRVKIPTIGIGAGGACDGQVLVFADLLGLSDDPLPRFVRRYATLGEIAKKAIESFAEDVRTGSYPAEKECYPTPPELAVALVKLPVEE